MENKAMKQFNAARRVGTPLMGISSFDPEATIREILTQGDSGAFIQWDISRGWLPRGADAASKRRAEKAMAQALGEDAEIDETKHHPVKHLEFAVNFSEDTVLLLLNGHHYLSDPRFIQALWNLRDIFKANACAVVMLSPSFNLPEELQQDFLLIEEELPTNEQLKLIVTSTVTDAELDLKVKPKTIDLAVDALRGLAAFPAEQATAMCLSKEGLHIDELWDRKRSLISQAPGLSVYKDPMDFSKIGGLYAIKEKFKRIIKGKAKPKAIVFIDEIEKVMAGSEHDSSGTSQDQLGVLLSEMQDKKYSGCLFIGPPGAAKSAFAKSIANEAGVLTIRMDLGDMKGSLVGESEQKIRNAMKVIQAVAGEEGAFFIATSNDIRVVKPELKRRFRKGIYFFDLPDAEERQAIWKLKCAEKSLTYRQDRIGFDVNWTGAEIENCVLTAWEEDITFEEAAKSIVPVAVSGKEEIQRLRNEANGRYLSASYPGTYQIPLDNSVEETPSKRKIKL